MESAVHDQAVAGLPQDVQDGLKSLKKRTKLLKIFLLVGLPVWAFLTIASYAVNPNNPFSTGASGGFLFFGFMILTIFWLPAYVISYSAWAYRANKNLEFMAVDGVVNTPADAMLWHIVPWAMFLMTFRVLRELWRGSDPDQPIGAHTKDIPTNILIKVWYGLFLFEFVGVLLYLVAIGIKIGISNESMAGLDLVLWQTIREVMTATALNYAAGAIIFIVIIDKLSVRQVARAEKVNAYAPDMLLPKHREMLRLKIGLAAAWRRKTQLLVICKIYGVMTFVELVAIWSVIGYLYEPRVEKYYLVFSVASGVDELSSLSNMAFILFLMWSYSCHRNLEAMKVTGVRYSPLKAVFWWLIPVFNLFGGAGTISEMWRGSNPKLGVGDDINNSKKLWLIPLNMLCLAGIVLFTVLGDYVFDQITINLKRNIFYGIFTPLALMIIAIILFVVIVYKTTNNQMARAEMIYGPSILPDQVLTQRRPPDKPTYPPGYDDDKLNKLRLP